MGEAHGSGQSFLPRLSAGRTTLWIASVALVYFGAARLGLSLLFQPEGIAAVWPPTGIFLSAVLLSPRRTRPLLVAVLLVVDFVAEMLSGTPLPVSAIYALALAGDAVLSAWLLGRFVGEPITFSRIGDIVGFLGLSVILSNALFSIVAASAASAMIPGATFGDSWTKWAASDAIGNLLVTPFILGGTAWIRTEAATWNGKRWLECAALLVSMTFLNIVAFRAAEGSALFSLLLFYATFPFLIWAALRFGVPGVTSTLVILAAIAVSFAATGPAPDSSGGSLLNHVIDVQLYLAVMAVPSLLLAVVVTERRRSEDGLRQSEARLSKAEEIAHVGSWEFDVPANRLTWSREVYRIFGLAPKSFPATYESFLDAVHPGDRSAVDAAYSVSLREGKDGYDIVHRVVRKTTGEIRHVHERCEHIRDASRRIVRSVGMVHDVTERSLAEEALRESEERFRTLIEQAGDGFELLDADGRFLAVNGTTCRHLGYTHDELLRMSVFDIDPQNSPAWYAERFQSLVNSPPITFEAVHRRKDGTTFPVEITTSVIRVADDLQAVTLVRDITERKRMEDEREKLQAQFLQAQKMESVGRLAGGVAHDFNNMLEVILGHAELAQEEMPREGGQPLRTHLEEIQKAAQRSADLTRQLLAFARRQTVAPRVLDLNDTVGGMLKMLRRLIGEDIDLAWVPGAELNQVKIDPAQIDQVLANLCVNARDSIAGVGKVTIETHNITLDEAYCADHAGFFPGAFVMLAVSDDGTGMEKEVLDHLFEPFFTTKGMGHGTGLGLATVYGIVRQNEGFINVYSEPGAGTTFKLYLPCSADQAAAVSAASAALANPRGNGTILLVEDEKSLLLLGTSFLEGQGYRVLTARTPGDAIALAETFTEEIHLLVTDVVLPEMNGRELSERIRAIRPGIKRLFMSGYTANVIAHRGVLDEGVQFIQKPFSIRALANKVREVLDED